MEVDTNTKFFHSLIRCRMRRLFIHKIHENGEWLLGEENICKASYEYFQQMFTGEEKIINEENLDCIPRMVNQEQNDRLISPLLPWMN